MSQPDKLPAISSDLSFTTPPNYISDVSKWWASLAWRSLNITAKAPLRLLESVEKTKQALVLPLLPRNSSIGRPFSPLSMGGLTAVIALGGTLFGHNGVMKPASSQASKAQVSLALYDAKVTTSDVMIDSTKVRTVIPADRIRDSVITHKVVAGDTLESVAQKYAITADTIRYGNNLDATKPLQPGQELSILPVPGVLYEVKAGDSIESIAQKWKAPAQAIVDVNYLDEPYHVTVGQKLVVPNAEIPKPPVPTKKVVSKATGPVVGSGIFSFPTSGQITQYYSYFHNGIDIGAMGAAPAVNAADGGKVTFAGWWAGGGGNSVWVDHGNGYITMYAHLSRILVSVGQGVSRGQQLGVMGETGRAFGIHLHFMVEKNGQVINPLTVL